MPILLHLIVLAFFSIVSVDSVVELTMDYREMVLFEADVVAKIVEVFMRKVLPKNDEKRCTKCKKGHPLEGTEQAPPMDATATAFDVQKAFFDELETILNGVDNAELRQRYQHFMHQFALFLKQINAVVEQQVDDHHHPQQQHTANSGANASQILRKTLKQICAANHRRYDALSNDLKKTKGQMKLTEQMEKEQQKMLKDFLHIKLIPLNGEAVDESKIREGELEEDNQIWLSVYELTSYKPFKHIALFVNGTEIHYGYYGVRLTKFRDFGSAKSMPFIKKVLLSNVVTRFSVRQIQWVLDSLELGPYSDYTFVEHNCSDFTKDLLKIICLIKPPETDEHIGTAGYGTYPPQMITYLEWTASALEKLPLLCKDKEFKKVDFLNSPPFLQFVKKGPSALKKVTEYYAGLMTTLGGMRRRKTVM